MKSLSLLPFLLSLTSATPNASVNGTNYVGIYKDQVEAFLGIRYGQDTSHANRFKPPKLYCPDAGSTIHAIDPGPACPQQLGTNALPLYLGNITDVSEDCLRLNINRPNGTTSSSKLPVMVFIHGGSYIHVSKDDPTSQPGGLILQSIAIDHPMIHIGINYRLGVFGFAQSDALKSEGSENAGLRDHRLALEWVKNNVASFGGDPDRITLHGQSSGGQATGLQTLAFGASQPAPFHRIIAQSQVLEGGIAGGNFTRNAMARVAEATGCNATDLQSAATVRCLRDLSTQDLLNAELNTYETSASASIGDEWLPTVDGDFLPAAPSELLTTGRHYNVTTMIGFIENDAQIFPDSLPTTANGTYTYIRDFLPGFTEANVNTLLSLYPVSAYHDSHFPNGTIQITAQGYRTGRILRDIILTCQTTFFGNAMMKAGNDVYYYNVNQTFIIPILETFGLYGYGKVHTSEFAYMWGNISHYDIYDFPYHPTESDLALEQRMSRSWALYAATGNPSLSGSGSLQGWEKADNGNENYGIYVAGGPSEGYSGQGGNQATIDAMKLELLQERCGFLDRPDVVKQDGY